ncbi:MAG: hypothetical protein O7B25_11645 [Gammaproteobacteria bacterium]|nr:hypothetical protein [Gammaproteobacteria bacterium]
MRFLFGLSLGAVLTLGVATAFNVPTHVLVDKAKTSWDDFLRAGRHTLFEAPQQPATDLGLGSTLEMKALDMDADSVEHPTPTAALPATASESLDLDALLASAVTPSDEAEAVAPARPINVVVADLDLPTQTVWVPFRSQMSAQGFARGLTGKLDYPFRVDREGPGRYQVLFSYANEIDRLDVLDQVKFFTGQQQQ